MVVVVVKAAVEADVAKATLKGSQQPRETNREAGALIMFLRNKKSQEFATSCFSETHLPPPPVLCSSRLAMKPSHDDHE